LPQLATESLNEEIPQAIVGLTQQVLYLRLETLAHVVGMSTTPGFEFLRHVTGQVLSDVCSKLRLRLTARLAGADVFPPRELHDPVAPHRSQDGMWPEAPQSDVNVPSVAPWMQL
jgi:hypothetical protein